MSSRIVTISREFGSGGRTVARLTAEKLGFDYYDNELVTKLAEESGFCEEFIRENGEHASYTNSLLFGLSIASMSNGYNMSSFDKLYIAQQKLIRELAEKGGCVIVGRCADFILRERRDVLSVFIHADDDYKAKRITELYGEREESVQKRIRDKNLRRKTYYKYYTDRTWGASGNYHLTLNSGYIGIEKCADIIADLARAGRAE